MTDRNPKGVLSEKMFKELKAHGLKLSPLEEELGFCSSKLRGDKVRHLSSSQVEILTEMIIEKASRLVSFKFTSEHHFDRVVDVTCIKESWIAEQLGITKQAFNAHKLRGFSPERKKEIERILHELGRALQKICRSYLGELKKAA